LAAFLLILLADTARAGMISKVTPRVPALWMDIILILQRIGSLMVTKIRKTPSNVRLEYCLGSSPNLLGIHRLFLK